MTDGFKIYYGDGAPPIEGPPEVLSSLWIYPYENVMCIAWNDPEKGVADLGRVVIDQWDIYIYTDGLGWHGTNKYQNLMTHLGMHGCGPGGVRSVINGLWIPRSNFDAIIKRAWEDPGFDRKSATDPIREDGSE